NVDIPLRAGRTLEGVVTDPAGKPISGVRVALMVAAPYGTARPQHRFGYDVPWAWPDGVVTDGKGRWRILEFPYKDSSPEIGGRWILVLDHDCYTPVVLQRLEAYPAVDGVVAVETTLHPGRSVTGLVLDPNGEPVAGAALYARRKLDSLWDFDPSRIAKSDDA